MFKITDDSGFLAIVVPTTYEAFVDSDWTFESITHHFKSQMECGSLLIWGTGAEGIWNVKLSLKPTQVKGHREFTAPLRVRGNSALFTSYESLTMAAQYRNVALPQPHEREQYFQIPNGNYACRVLQMFDSEEQESAGEDKPDFVVELLETIDNIKILDSIPWFGSDVDPQKS